ncbi:MAG: alpha-glucuronidase family glycosyl hydrolase [Verrucomicrobiota bacterium]
MSLTCVKLWQWLGRCVGGVALLLVGFSAAAEDGYRLWLRYQPISNVAQRENYSAHISEIIMPTNSPTQRVIRDELRRGVEGMLGRKPSVRASVTREWALVIGTPANNATIAALGLNEKLGKLSPEGYLIRSITNAGRAMTVIVSRSDVGALYGAFHFLQLMQMERDISALDVVEQPMHERRLLNHWDNLDGSIERGYAGKSLWQWQDLPQHLNVRYRDYARVNASLGLNGAVLNNVNAKADQLSTENLRKAAALAEAFRPYGIRVYLSVNFASPQKLGGLRTADPFDAEVQQWWRSKVDEIYRLMPDFGGFLVKANSEGQPGPQDYLRTHADGANMLADTLAPHGGIVMWRAFVYNSPHVDKDRAKRAYLEFMPFDGQFRSNVIVQVKNGPIDFQPREPFHPLFGAMRQTSLMAELEITQENMGHATHLVYLAPMWQEFFGSDTFANGPGSAVSRVLTNSRLTAIAGVANTGRDQNWCGHDFAQANWYAFGRLAWNSQRSAAELAEEWARLTWGNEPQVASTVTNMMLGSWEACVSYEMPLGIHHIMEPGGHYDPFPHLQNKSSPEYSSVYYHKADLGGIGFDRTATGSDAVSQYAPSVRDHFANRTTCPLELLLWFHHMNWDDRLPSGRTVWEELCFRYNDGVDYVKRMQTQWESLRGRVDAARFEAVRKKLEAQRLHATKWRDVCVAYFQSVNQKSLPAYLRTP